MADQEFIVSFKAEIDDTGVERMKSVLEENMQMAEEMAGAFEAARSSVSNFFSELQNANSLNGELGPIQQLKDLASEGAEFKITLDSTEAQEQLESFIETANGIFEETEFPLKAESEQALQMAEELIDQINEMFEGQEFPIKADNSQALEVGEETIEEIQGLFEGIEFPIQAENSQAIDVGNMTIEEIMGMFEATDFPLKGDNKNVLQQGQSALNELMRIYGSTYLPLLADASSIVAEGESALAELEALYANTTLTVNVQEVTTTTVTESADEAATSNVTEGANQVVKPTKEVIIPARPATGMGLQTIMRASTGGKFSSPTKLEVAEDGDTEYVVPVKKEGIAVPLMSQIIGELSEGARKTLQNAFLGLSGSGQGNIQPEGQSMVAASSGAAAPMVMQTNNNSVQAPVSIQVTTGSADPEEVGRSIYNIQEMFLLRTLQAAM